MTDPHNDQGYTFGMKTEKCTEHGLTLPAGEYTCTLCDAAINGTKVENASIVEPLVSGIPEGMSIYGFNKMHLDKAAAGRKKKRLAALSRAEENRLKREEKEHRVLDMRKMHADGFTEDDLIAHFGLSRTKVRGIITFKTFKNLKESDFEQVEIDDETTDEDVPE